VSIAESWFHESVPGRAQLNSLENKAPEGRTNLAQRFSAGKSGKNDLSPGGTTQFSRKPFRGCASKTDFFRSLLFEASCFNIVPCLEQHLALVAVSKLSGRVGKGHPESALDLDPHVGSKDVDFSRHITHQVKANDFENARAIAPAADVDI